MRSRVAKACLGHLAGVAAFAAFAGGLPSCPATAAELSATATGNVCGLPSEWRTEDFAAHVPPYGVNGRLVVLAWQIVEDDRPFRVERCLVLKVLDGGRGYHLAQLYRNPLLPDPAWRLATTHVAPPAGVQEPGRLLFHAAEFAHRPTNRELYAALAPDQVRWSFDVEPGWKLVAGRVCDESWLETIGEKPTRFFPP